jgi:hypothetical protein
MKAKTKMLAILFAVIIVSVIQTKKLSAQQNYVSFDVFYDQLSPYGQWVDYPEYGYVWIPDAGSDFVPYSTRGHWIMTDYSWTWMSDYNWGWAPFHYGRWDFDNLYGWFWVPDGEWGPAWVNWRSSDGYYGWEPMQPGISIEVSFRRGYNDQNDHWLFVRDRYIDRPNINRYYVRRSDHERIIRNSIVINNTYVDNGRHTTYVTGPAREDVQRVTGRRVSAVSIQESNRPGQNMRNGRLNIYRPEVRRNNNSEQKSAPSRIVELKEVKRPAERNQIYQKRNGNVINNTSRERQSNPVNNMDNSNNSRQVEQRSANPSNNNRREKKSGVVNQQDNNSNSKSEQQKANSTRNNRRETQTNSVKQSNQSSNDQPKKSKSERNKRRNE